MNVYIIIEKQYKNSKLYDVKFTSVFKTLEDAKRSIIDKYTDKENWNYCRLFELDMKSGDWGKIRAMYEYFVKPGDYTDVVIYESTLIET